MNQFFSPNFIYGTAWKEDQTEECVLNALKAGFRAIDTANQRKHYFEEAVGKAIVKAHELFGIKREDLFIQSKFTFQNGQDHRLPYDPNAPVATQVQQSFQSSLKHLNTSYLDSLLLHGPSTRPGLSDKDYEAWRAMESLKSSGTIKYIGLSNVSLEQLHLFCEHAKVKPSFVQNRCYAETHWDQEIRSFCKMNNIIYQGFSLLTANRNFLGGSIQQTHSRKPQLVLENNSSTSLSPKLSDICTRYNKSISQIIFRFFQYENLIPITGTQSPAHMSEDLNIENFNLSEEDRKTIEYIAI